MTDSAPDMKELKAIIDWVNVAEDVRELSLKFGDVELHVSRNADSGGSLREPAAAPPPAAAPAAAPTVPAPVAASAAPDPDPAPEQPKPTGAAADAAVDAAVAADDEVIVAAPMVGAFYAAPQPGAPAFVSVGDRVQPNTVLGIVEVMKLMNNIEAGVHGSVVRILVENESLVEYGQPLVVIKKDAS
ncbi:acetyl-CoA carboxylase biotin carboxyl carrier protein [Leucobacter luti]|uniref:acetyl-CoA carboxylase biotin carboxyl carrier protein n=1 Tax=Leucobacter luti TaxID=340320 RepID=UPI003D0468DF